MYVQWILGLIMGLKLEASVHHIPKLGFLVSCSVVLVKTHALAWSGHPSYKQAKLCLTTVTYYRDTSPKAV